MATCQTSQWVSTAPYVKLTVTESSNTATSSTLSWTLQYVASSAANTNTARSYSVVIAGSTVKSGTYNINGKTGTNTIASGTKTITKTTSTQSISFSVSFAFNLTWSGSYAGTKSASGSTSVSAKTSYKVTYNNNGGSGAPSAQTKWHDTALTLSSTKPTRTGYTFKGWGTSSSATTVAYAAGASYTANAAITLYAVWEAVTYTVKYDANKGTGAPGNQTKTYGKTLTLSSTKPTRTNYIFKGWGTSSSATTVAYAAGASYTKNAAITLYAIWELGYVKPRISNVSVTRCNESGGATDDGTNALVTFDWECDKTVSSIVVKWKLPSDTAWTSVSIGKTGTSGTVSHVIGSNSLNAELSYDIHITVSDASGSSYVTDTLSSMRFVIDCLSGGAGIAFGKTAELENTAEFEFDSKFNKPVYGKALGLDKLPEIPSGSDLNNYMETGCWAVYKNSIAETIANIPINRAGRLIVISGTGEGIRSEQWSYLRQKYIPYNMNNATWERDISRDDTNVWHYYPWYRTTLDQYKSEEVYHNQIVLWEGAMYMTAGHTANLAEAVTAQPNGIVLVFSKYSDGAAQENNFNSFFVPKIFITSHKGYGNAFTMMDINFGKICHKYLYINDTAISGHANNNASGTGTSGIVYDNKAYVLRYVYGV